MRRRRKSRRSKKAKNISHKYKNKNMKGHEIEDDSQGVCIGVFCNNYLPEKRSSVALTLLSAEPRNVFSDGRI